MKRHDTAAAIDTGACVNFNVERTRHYRGDHQLVRASGDSVRVLLQEAGLSSQVIEGIIRLAVLANKAGQGEALVVASDDTSAIHLSNVNLDSCMVLGTNKAASGRAIMSIRKPVLGGL